MNGFPAVLLDQQADEPTMKTNTTRVIAALAIGVVAIALINRSDFDSEEASAEGQLAQSSTTSVSDRELAEENKLSPVDSAAVPSRDMRMEVDVIQKEPDFKEWPGLLFDLMHKASMKDVHEVLAISENAAAYSLGFRDSMKAAAFERWYHLDPAAALLAMDASSLSASQKNSRMEVFLEEWAGRSPQEVAAFLEQGQLAGVSSDLTYGALVRGSALNGATETVDAALGEIGDPKLRFYALKSAARVLQRDHGGQFDAWLSTLPDSDQNTALAESAWMLADKEIERALAGLDRLEERGADELPVTRQRVVVKWAQNEPAKAAAWVAAQKVTGRDREVLFANVLSVWVAKDQSAAVAWVDSLIAKGEIDEAFLNRVAAK
ncbi:hypothetical protein N9A94_04905 [Akkermansiaceae bacterium]|nr:hypothetical protein [Akkermansiaceae bacterium]